MNEDCIIELHDEEGNAVRFEFLDLIAYEGEEYVVLYPVDDDDQQVVILQLAESDDPEEQDYLSVEDDEVLQAVFNIFKEKFKDEYNFEE